MPTAVDPVQARTSMGRGFEIIAALALADQGLVARGEDQRYRLAWGWYAAAQDLTDHRLHTAGLSTLDGLAGAVGEPCFLGVLHGDSTRTIVESVPAASRMIGSWVGRAYPAFCSDAGQAALWDASDDEVRAVFAKTAFTSRGPNAPRSVDDFLVRLHAARERGYAIVDEEAEPGLYSVSVPVWDFRHEVVAGIQIVGERAALRPRTEELAAACLGASATLSAALGSPHATGPAQG
jgi:DNA-binding IclR family transcriptional regulator